VSTKDELLKIFSLKLRTVFGKLNIDYGKLQEIRLRINAPLLIIYIATRKPSYQRIQVLFMILPKQ
jgi:stage III sporulation protein SpoIIIAA